MYNEQITKEDIFKVVPQSDIYSHYIGETMETGYKINSPLRDDNIPSFAIFYHKTDKDVLMFYDFATKHCGDSIIFVCMLFGIGYKEALFKIAFDFGLTNVEITAERRQVINATRLIEKEQVRIGINKRPWKKHDAEFWKSFGITKATLNKYNVVPIKYVYFNGNASIVDSHAYAYLEFKDGEVTYKIYQPYNKKYKWINNANYTVHQGYSKLPKKGELLIITKSLKDVMAIRDTLRVPAIGLQSESVMMKDSVMDEYKSRFEHVVCLFDNDKAGIALSIDFSERYGVPHFFMPVLPGVTDYSDLVKKVGVDEAKVMFIDSFKQIDNEIRNHKWY